MTTTISTFSFQEKTFLQTSLDDVMYMRIAPTGPSVARVYFVHSNTHDEVPIPSGITIYDNTNQCKVVKLYSTESFALYWGDNYTIKYNDVTVYELVTQRQWSVTATTKP